MRTMKMNCFAIVLVLALAPVATVSAEVYTDNFNRADSTDLGSNWSATWGTPQLNIVSNTAAPSDLVSPKVSAYTAHQASGNSQVLATTEFQASYWAGNVGCPNMYLGLNNTANSWFDGDFLYVQGVVGVKMWVDGNWRDTSSSVSLTAGDWYRLSLEQNGANFTGTLSTLGGTTLLQNTYTSAVKTSSTGAAFIGSGNFGGAEYVGTPAFDNFSLTIVPEPGTMVLLGTGLLGLLAYAWRKRK